MSYNSEVLADSPLSRWSFEEVAGTTIDDSQTATRDGTINGGVTLNQSAGLPGANKGADFNGSSGYVSFGNASGLLGIGTIEAVVMFDTIPASNSPAIFSHAYTSGQLLPLVLGFNVGAVGAGLLGVGYFTGSAWVTTHWATAPQTGVAYHVVGKYDGTTLKLRVNGVEVASTTVGTARPGSGTVNSTSYIGRRWDLAQYHDGKIWDIAIYASALSDARIDAHYNAVIDDGLPPAITATTTFTAGGILNILYTLNQGYAVPVTVDVTGDVTQTYNPGAGRRRHVSISGLTNGQTYNITLTPSNTYGTGAAYPMTVTLQSDPYMTQVLQDSPGVYHPLGETSGTTALDYGLGDFDGSYANGVVLADTSVPAPLVSFGNNVRLDGTNDHIQLESSTWLAPSAGFTFEGEFYFRSWTNWMRVFDFASSASVEDMYLAANSSGTMTLKVNGTAMTFARFPTSQWVYIAVTITSAGAATIYQDGVSVATGTVGVPTNGTRAFKYIGRSAYAADPYLAASVAHVAVYNSALNLARVQAHAAEIVPSAQDRIAIGYIYADANIGQGAIPLNQNAYFLADVNIGQNSPQNTTAFIESDAYVIARRFIGWGVPTGM